ncbi:MAG: GNAT family N-acetyltransferase [Hyphomicrobiales bacterium]
MIELCFRKNGVETSKEIQIRPAKREDAPKLARLIDIAGEGIPDWLWRSMAEPGQTALDVGTTRAERDSGGFSYTNAIVAEAEGTAIGMMLGYVVAAPEAEDVSSVGELPEVFRPFVQLEHLSIGSFYINALAVAPGLRGLGLGRLLLKSAERKAASLDVKCLSIQAFSQNQGAIRLYTNMGFARTDSRPVLSHPCQPYYDEDVWLLKKAIH